MLGHDGGRCRLGVGKQEHEGNDDETTKSNCTFSLDILRHGKDKTQEEAHAGGARECAEGEQK